MLSRRFGVASVEGTCYFDYDCLLSFIKKISECESLTWEVPYTSKMAHFYAASAHEQARALEGFKRLFNGKQVLIFFRRNPTSLSEFLSSEELFSWIDSKLEETEGDIRSVVVWIGPQNTKEEVAFLKEVAFYKALQDVVCKSLRTLRISLQDVDINAFCCSVE